MRLHHLFCVVSALTLTGCQAVAPGAEPGDESADPAEGIDNEGTLPGDDADTLASPGSDDAAEAVQGPPAQAMRWFHFWRRDGGVRDARVRDAGTPTTDTGPRDAGTPATDTGPRDVGTPTTDTGPRDAGTLPPPPPPPSGGSCPTTPLLSSMTAPSFPGAEGFGAVTTGGRGGRLCVVTNKASSGGGSLQACLDQTGPRTVVFRTSGVINGPLNLRTGDVTIAGQTSPGGIIINGGFYCDNVYESGSNCQNVVMRHLRLRRGDDTLRLGGANRVIVDHCSFENAGDESIEISRSRDITVQYSVIAEPVGGHYRWAGILVNYSKSTHPLDRLSIHHNVWNGCFGRLPELSCEENPDGPGTTNCAGRRLQAEVSNNLYFDVSDPLWYNRCIGTNEGNDCAVAPSNFTLGVNFVGNVMHRRRAIADQPIFANEVGRSTANDLFWTGNLQTLTTGTLSTATVALPSRSARHGYPPITMVPTNTLLTHLQSQAGAFPRDTMDTRLAGYLSGSVENRPVAWSGGNGIDRGDALRVTAPTSAPPVDTDGDGMPDAWETARGLNPQCAGGHLTSLASRSNNGVEGCTAGYTDLECYLNELAAQRVRENR
jgi:pectate lyase